MHRENFQAYEARFGHTKAGSKSTINGILARDATIKQVYRGGKEICVQSFSLLSGGGSHSKRLLAESWAGSWQSRWTNSVGTRKRGQHGLPVKSAAAGIEAGRAGGFHTLGLGPRERVGNAEYIMDSLKDAHLNEILNLFG
jgi:hypothetical protein